MRPVKTISREQPGGVRIDIDRCTGCGACITVCPDTMIDMVEGRTTVCPDDCMQCAHCSEACPPACISVATIDKQASHFRSFEADTRWLPHGQFDTGQLVRLMASRRSCRNYSDREVPRVMLEDLVKIGITAPSGTNSQKWTFTLIPRRQGVTTLGEAIACFFKRLNKKAENRWLRWGLKAVGNSRLDQYYRNYYSTVKEGLDEWDHGGRDRLFHGATAVIIVGSAAGASCPAEDALLASQNILLGAHSMGLGTCLIGYAVAAMRADASIQQRLGMNKEESVHAVIAVGFPSESYVRTAERRMPTMRWSDV